MLKDPRYATLNARSLHINDMYAMVEALTPQRTTAEWVDLLDKAQIPNAPVAKPGDVTYKARTESVLLIEGECPFHSDEEILAFLDSIQASRQSRPTVINRNRSNLASQLPAELQQIVVAPLLEEDRALGYLIAMNHSDDAEFGTVEANLLASVSAMLGVHCSNRDLYRQQDEFLASVVRALTSAIDAKDPYTCGHSDRVARVATRIAQHLGCDTEFLSTI